MASARPSSDPLFLAAYGDTLRRLREDRGLDRKDLAEAAGVSYSYLSAIESGHRLPSETVQAALADALSITVPDFLARVNGAFEGGLSPVDEQRLPAGTSFPEAIPAPVMEEDPPAGSGISASGALAELRVLLPSLSGEDAAMVVSLARRLSATGGSARSTNAGPRRRDRTRQGLRTEAYLQFWTMYLEELDRRHLDWARGRTAQPRSYFTTPSPLRGSSLSASFARNRLLRHEIYINRGSRAANLELLHDLEARRQTLEAAYGHRLDFEDPGRERRAVRIAEYREGHISRTDDFEEYIAWFIDRGIRMRRALEASD